MIAGVVRTLVIVLISTALGGVTAAWRGFSWVPDFEKIRQGNDIHDRIKTLNPREKAAISFEQFQSLVEQGAVVIDARPAPEFVKGHLRIDGAAVPVLNIAAEDLGRNIERLEGLRGLTWVLYCTSDHCEFAEDLYGALNLYGLLDEALVKIYFPGWEDFQKRGLAVATGPDNWRPEQDRVSPEDSQYQSNLLTSGPKYPASGQAHNEDAPKEP